MNRRGDVVLVDLPHSNGTSKVRPSLVIQNDRDNSRLQKTIIAIITGNLRRSGDPSHVLVDPTNTEQASSGLHGPSLISCNNLYTIEQTAILRTIGHLSDALIRQVNESLKITLDLA